MDREISKEVRQKEKRHLILKVIIGIIIIAGVMTGLSFLFSSGIKGSDLKFAKAEIASLESSVPASGKIVPLYEQSIVSPVSTRILQVFLNEGDSVKMNESLLRLDLQSTESEFRRLEDEVSMKNLAISQAAINNETNITDMEMKIKAKEMSVNHLKEEVANEIRLDSIGSGTGDRIREAELAYQTALLELEQMKVQLANERKSLQAALKSRELEGDISRRNLMEMERTLDDAKIKSPTSGIVTFLNKNIGTTVAAGEKLAVVSDLSHFKISAEIPEGNAGKLAIGSPVIVRFNRYSVKGHISAISPQSTDAMINFIVVLDNDNEPGLRSGLRTELNVIYDVKDNVLRIPNGPYFEGPGNYYMFVKKSDEKLIRKLVTLGDSNFDFVEVISGLEPGEEVVVNNMSEYRNKKELTIKN